MRKGGIATAVFAAALAAGALAQGGAWAQEAARGGSGGELPARRQERLPAAFVVGFAGAPQSDALGELGIGSPDDAARRLERQARPYNSLSNKKLLPVFELDRHDLLRRAQVTTASTAFASQTA